MSFSGENPSDAATPVDTRGASGPRAGFWQRFGASFLDAVIIVIIELVLLAMLKGAAGIGAAWVLGAAYFTYLEGGSRGQTPSEPWASVQ